ncbi:MAG: bifunctional hydroxymethylpyrimidine kinase/phosphomethylpyrimidine kinase [Oscillospiraceae bacterium]|nr:bifunctional hydroxymethylpyrimidine kinase/phosphomethylpyrimidine kinase [Oscillospiraceae bacterium]
MIGKVLTIAGSDSGGGAGVQADIKTITMHGCYAMSVITALTAQNTCEVSGILEVPPEFVAAQMDAVFTDLSPDAVKIGMVSGSGTVHVLASKLREYKPKNIVIDPVMISTSGQRLLQPQAMNALIVELLPLADILTPNIPEAEALSGLTISDIADMKAAAALLSERFDSAVLIKGGHLPDSATDVLCDRGKTVELPGQRVKTENTHGTGCTLSAAIASNLSKGMNNMVSICTAKGYLASALRAGFDIGKGKGPLLHNFNIAH